MRRLLIAVPVLLAAVALGACGDDDEQPASAPPSDGTELQVEVTHAASRPIRMTLRCDGKCDVATLKKALRQDPERACTQQYGGPEKARVTGTLDGEPVDVTIDRADGCGIAAYQLLFTTFGRQPPLAG
jgi:hypothetical protein